MAHTLYTHDSEHAELTKKLVPILEKKRIAAGGKGNKIKAIDVSTIIYSRGLQHPDTLQELKSKSKTNSR